MITLVSVHIKKWPLDVLLMDWLCLPYKKKLNKYTEKFPYRQLY